MLATYICHANPDAAKNDVIDFAVRAGVNNDIVGRSYISELACLKKPQLKSKDLQSTRAIP